MDLKAWGAEANARIIAPFIAPFVDDRKLAEKAIDNNLIPDNLREYLIELIF